MRFNHRSVVHWLVVALIAALGLFTYNHARGQGSSAAAAFLGESTPAAAAPGE